MIGIGLHLNGVNMETRNLFRVLALAALGSVLFAQLAMAQISSINNVLSVYDFGVSPQPVVAGQNITLQYQLFNSYDAALQDVNLQLTASNPIINVSPSSTYLISSIGTGEYGGTNGGVFTAHLHIPDTLSAGEYTIYLSATYQTTYGGATLPGTSSIPLSFYVYGTPDIQLTATPIGQIVPGGQSTVQLGMINTGTDTARNLTVTVLNSQYFEPYGSPKSNFGIVASGSSGSAELTLQTSAQLPIGNLTLPVMISYTAQDGKSYSYTSNIPINFVPSDPYIVASIQGATPSQLYAGSNQTLSVLIQNIGYGDAKNLSVDFLSTPSITVSGAASNFFIGTLPAGQSKSVSVFVSASSNANLTNYTIPVRLNYRGVDYQSNLSRTQFMPINLQSSSIFSVTSVSGSVAAGSAYQPVTFTIKNTGDEPAQQVYINLQTVYPVSPVNANFYIDQLNPGQSTNVTFYVNIDSHGNTGSYPVTLYEQWRQPNGYTTQQYYGSDSYYINVSGSQSQNPDYTYAEYAVVVIVIIAAVIMYRKRIAVKGVMKEKQKQNK